MLSGCEGVPKFRSRIANGNPTNLEEFPWLALLKYNTTKGHIKYRCHGNLITPKYVLTAAHCLQMNPVLETKYGKV